MTLIFGLAAILERTGVSQSELARQTGLSVRTINRLCRNATAAIALSTLDAIATALKVEPGDLIVREKGKRRA